MLIGFGLQLLLSLHRLVLFLFKSFWGVYNWDARSCRKFNQTGILSRFRLFLFEFKIFLSNLLYCSVFLTLRQMDQINLWLNLFDQFSHKLHTRQLNSRELWSCTTFVLVRCSRFVHLNIQFCAILSRFCCNIAWGRNFSLRLTTIVACEGLSHLTMTSKKLVWLAFRWDNILLRVLLFWLLLTVLAFHLVMWTLLTTELFWCGQLSCRNKLQLVGTHLFVWSWQDLILLVHY